MDYNGQTETDREELLKTANALDNAADEFARSVKILYNQIYDLSELWGGGLNRKFIERFEGDRFVLENMGDILSEYAQVLRDNARIYDAAENEVMDILRRPSIY